MLFFRRHLFCYNKSAVVFLLLFSVQLFSQKYNFQNFSVTDGISQSQIYALMQDDKGVLWIGTRGGGITCYDGKNFKNITTEQNLGNNFINSIVQDSARTIWIGTNNGLTSYNNHRFKNYFLKTESNHSIIVNQVYLFGKEILLATSNGVYVYKNNTVSPFIKNFTKQIRSLCAVHSTVFVATEEGIYKIEKGEAKLLIDKYGISPRSITYIISDEKNKLWIATYGDGVYSYENDVYQRIDDNKELAKRTVLHLFKDENNLWISTLDKGIAQYNINSKQFNWLTQSEGLCNNHIRCCIKDISGNYWIGSSGGGLSYYKGQQFIHYQLNQTSNLVYSIYHDSNNSLWIGNSDKGLSAKIGNEFVTYNSSNGFIDAKVKAICETHRHQLLFGTDGSGLYQFDSKNFKLLPEFKNKYIKHLIKSKDQSIWIATAGAGIYQLNYTNNKETSYELKHFTEKNNNLLSDRVNCLIEDTYGNVWYGTDNNGIGLIKNGVAKKLILNTDIIRGFSLDKQKTLWVATSNGVLSIALADNFKTKQFLKQDGLTSNNIYSIIISDKNHVLIGHEKGIDQLLVNNNRQITDIKHFGFQDGFLGVETTQNAIAKDEKGNVWFGTINGLTEYNISQQNKNNQAPKIQLNDIRLFYLPIKNLAYDSINTNNFYQSITLPYNENHLTFDFLGVYLHHPTKVKYDWKLEGLESTWSPLSKQESVTYPNLLPGTYTFLVRAYNEDNVCSKPLSYTFTIKAPWWKTWWFSVLWIGSLLTLGYLIYKWRSQLLLKKIKEQEQKNTSEKNLLELQQKTLRLQMNPHFMFNALNSIQNNIGGGNEQTARYYLAKYSKLMRMVLENSRNDLITLEDEIKMLDNYLLLEKFSNNDSFDYSITVNDNIEKQEILLPPLIIQPFIENAVIHGIKPLTTKGMIKIDFDLKENYLLCVVEDNGVGRVVKDFDENHKSTALIVTQERLDLLKENLNFKTIEIIDLKDEQLNPIGTKIMIKIPLQLH